jgi:hypothetical protein
MTNGYFIQCINCHNPILITPPKPEYELISIQPCPKCNGIGQNLICNCCYQEINYTGTKDTLMVVMIRWVSGGNGITIYTICICANQPVATSLVPYLEGDTILLLILLL